MSDYLSMTQGGHGYFFVGMTSFPADDASEACFLLPPPTGGNGARKHFFIASNGRLGARWHLGITHGRKPSRFVLDIECVLELGNIAEGL